MFACDMEPIRDFIASSSASYLRFIVEFQWFFIALSVLMESSTKFIENSFDTMKIHQIRTCQVNTWQFPPSGFRHVCAGCKSVDLRRPSKHSC